MITLTQNHLPALPLSAIHTTDDQTNTGLGKHFPPDPAHVRIYFAQQEQPGEAGNFLRHYEQNRWTAPRGGILKNWKTAAAEWLWQAKQRQRFASQPQQDV